MATQAERVLATPKALKEYLEILPSTLQLRFPSTTSLKGDLAVIMIIYNAVTQCVLLGAYDTTLSGLPKDEVTIDGEDHTTALIEEKPFNVLRFGVIKETGLVLTDSKWLGFPKRVDNTNNDLDINFHEKHYALINGFKGSVRIPDPILNPKIKEFVWVKAFLLDMIFDQHLTLFGVATKPHPQQEAYNRFIQSRKKKSTVVTLKEMLKGRFPRHRH